MMKDEDRDMFNAGLGEVVKRRLVREGVAALEQVGREIRDASICAQYGALLGAAGHLASAAAWGACGLACGVLAAVVRS